PRRINQQSKGDGTPPQVVWISRTRSEKSVLVFAIRTPPVTSECPPRYFVVECMTKSAPSSSGRWTIGAQVLSHAQIAPAACAISTTAALPVIFMSGLDGVSVQISLVV